MAQSSVRLLASLAVQNRRVLKQADCKNAFCQPTLPSDEVVVCKPPAGCPRSKPGELWRLRKTLYGLRRSPRHWYELIRSVFADLGLTPCPHAPSVFTGSPLPGQPPIYIAVYVDDLAYFLASDAVESWFETALQSKLRVTLMGEIEWFLGTHYQWTHHPSGDVSVAMTQSSTIQSLLDVNGLSDCKPVPTPYRSGLPVDALPETDAPPPGTLTQRYQSLVGSLNWLAVSTRPDLSAIVSILSSYLHAATDAHFDSALHVLRYLAGTITKGVGFSSLPNTALHSFLSFPPGGPPVPHDSASCFTDSCWGPQDASEPGPNPPDIPMHVTRSIGGFIVFRCGGPIAWSARREARTSRSSCEAEIKATDEATKEVQYLRLILEDLSLSDADAPIPVWNDNKGAIDWSRTRSTKRLRHYNIRENAIREAIQHREITLSHIFGKGNPADLCTKEHRDNAHFLALTSVVLTSRDHGG